MPVVDEVKQRTGRIQVRDWSIWTKHISGDASLASRLEALPEDTLVTLVVNGERGQWVKKKNSKTGAPTPGLKPVGPMRDTWFHWYNTRRGELLDIAWADGDSVPTDRPHRANGARARLDQASAAEQEAAWAAFEALGAAGWRYEGADPLNRDDLHSRE